MHAQMVNKWPSVAQRNRRISACWYLFRQIDRETILIAAVAGMTDRQEHMLPDLLSSPHILLQCVWYRFEHLRYHEYENVMELDLCC